MLMRAMMMTMATKHQRASPTKMTTSRQRIHHLGRRLRAEARSCRQRRERALRVSRCLRRRRALRVGRRLRRPRALLASRRLLWLRAKQATRVQRIQRVQLDRAMGKVSDSVLHEVRSRAKLATRIWIFFVQRLHLDRAMGKVIHTALHEVRLRAKLIRRERA